ncbi:hypothetical protein NUU61_009878 [Penicillium alfredii]|uniref:ABM domain-containing protein n=1 Tax=Penicillium alfredii TaxID=1506179 RepID=A0A9W9JTN0_9EURO|nr:uncharacterized protein NUU61_009878 [Penicillium alfredii]KAJ5081614.1 hypothetical protein NUU61_009878 [Penicillium alfredii]
MSQTVSEFVFFRVKPSVKPEDPSSEEGDALMSVFRNIKHYSGYQSSAWGRSAEDPNTIVWVVDWTDARGSVNAHQLDRFLAPDNAQPPAALHTTLNPPISSTDTLAKNPVTELCMLGFPSSMPAAETKQLFADLINFRTTLVEQLPQATGPRSWAMGHVDRPSLLQHAKSPSGQAVMHLLAVGWESVEAHKKAKETQEFVQSIAPIREKMLPPVPGLEMKHVSFQKL